jgi:hypothetical protein
MLLTAGCSGPPESTVVSVRLSSALGCRPTRIDSARIEALGDFPLRDEHVVVATDTSQVTLSGFPRTTSAIVVELTGGTFVGRGAVEIPAGTLGTSVLVLPPDRSCPIADPDVRLDEGASVVMLEDGSLLLVGGLLPDGTARRAVLALGAGEELADTDLRNLFNPSAFASTTPIGPREVLVAGGASERAGSGRDTFERLRLDDPPERAASGWHARGGTTRPQRPHALRWLGALGGRTWARGHARQPGDRLARGEPRRARARAPPPRACRGDARRARRWQRGDRGRRRGRWALECARDPLGRARRDRGRRSRSAARCERRGAPRASALLAGRRRHGAPRPLGRRAHRSLGRSGRGRTLGAGGTPGGLRGRRGGDPRRSAQ